MKKLKNGKNVDQYNKSLNNLGKVLRIDDFVPNKANEKPIETILYFVTQSQVFEINKLPFTINPTGKSICHCPRLWNLKKRRSESFNKPNAIIIGVSLSRYKSGDDGKQNFSWLLPFGGKNDILTSHVWYELFRLFVVLKLTIPIPVVWCDMSKIPFD